MVSEVTNTAMLHCVAKKLGPLRSKVVFMGTTILPFLMTNNTIWNQRQSKDVDFIVYFSSKNDIYEFEDALWEQGFKRGTIGPIYHWITEGIGVDVVPADPDVIGFNNQWSLEAVQYAQQANIGEDLVINMINSPYFLGVKFSAFDKRGKNNYMRSYDVADIVRVVYEDDDLIKKIQANASSNLRQFLCYQFNNLLKNNNIKEVIMNHLSEAYRTEAGVNKVLGRIENITEIM